MITQQELMRQKQDDTQNQIDKLRPLLKLIIQRTKELQIEVCHFRSRNATFSNNILLFTLNLITDRARYFQEIQE